MCKKKPLGEIFRDQKAQQGDATTRQAKRAADAKLKAIDSELFVAAETLHHKLEELLGSDEDSHIHIKIVPPHDLFDLEEESQNLQDLLDACEKENVSITAKRDRFSTGLSERHDGRIGTRPKMVYGIVLTIDPAQEFNGLEWERSRRNGRRPHGPRFR